MSGVRRSGAAGVARSPGGHVPALDGLRGVAVAAVVAYHLRPEWVPGGYLGVDLFFVLSGYLITSLLLAERERSGGIDLLAFAGRRLRRLMPAIVLVVVAVAVWAALDGDLAEIERARRHALASLAYVANWVFIADGDSYFAEVGGPSPLRHVWSLAIEEQFYLFWPLSVVVLGRLGGRRAVGYGAVAVAFASATWMAVLHVGGDPSRVYFGTDTRIFEPLIGAVAAVILPLGSPIANWWRGAGLTAAAGWLTIVLLVDDTWTGFYEGGAVGIGLVAIVLVLSSTSEGGILVAGLGWRPLVALGAISYGVYLWHWPMIIAARHRGWSGPGAELGIVAATLIVSALSYIAVERPIRHGVRLGRGNRWAPVGAGLAVLVVAAGVVIGVTRAEPSPDATSVEEVLSGLRSTTIPPAPSEAGESDDADLPDEPSLVTPEPTTVVLIGDSTAWTLGGGEVGFTTDHGPYESPFDPDEVVLVNLARKGYRLVPGATTDVGGTRERSEDDLANERWWRETINEIRPDVVALLLGVSDTQSRELDGVAIEFGTPSFDALIDESATGLVEQLALVAPVVFLTSPPLVADDMLEPRMSSYFAEHGVERIAHLNEVLVATASRLDRVTALDFAAWMCPSVAECRRDGDGDPLRDDGLHFTLDGARTAAGWLAPPLRRAAAIDPGA